MIRRWLNRMATRYIVVQRAGILGEGRELGRYTYFAWTSAQMFANRANRYTSHTWSTVERATPEDKASK